MTESPLTLGVIGTATKPNEKRAPLDPAHLSQIDPALRQRIYMETGYGNRFNVSDYELDQQVAGRGQALFRSLGCGQTYRSRFYVLSRRANCVGLAPLCPG